MAFFRVLGGVEASAGDQQLDLGTIKRRMVLVDLLVNPGVVLTTETLIDHIWDGNPPAAARNVIHAHLSRIRQVLTVASRDGEQMLLQRRSGGYVIRADPHLVDLHRFWRLVQTARDEDVDDPARAALLREAIELWRGEPLCGLTGVWMSQLREGLRQQHVDAAVTWAQAELHLGRHAAVIDRLRPLLADYPLAEPLAAALMTALYVAQRGAEALDCYNAIRGRLVEELGADPSPELQTIHLAILRGEHPTPDAARSPAPVTGDRPVTERAVRSPFPAIPRQLPLEAGGFSGRQAALEQLDMLLSEDGETPRPVPIAVISGTAGVGKTALAVRWAHRMAERFPDGQLYVNLRGFGPSAAPVTPREAIRGFLSALQVPAERVPVDPDAQVGLYRSLLAGKRMLILADNARDESQVRPLLPANPSCLVVVTSRRQLAGLITTEGAHPLTLDLLPPAEARDLLAQRLGHHRLAVQPEAVDDIVARCARLPLALAIVAARGSAHPDFPLATLAAELRDIGNSLDAFRGEDAATDLGAVFAWSYQMLRPDTGRLFRLLAVHPGPDITATAAASLTATPVSRTQFQLAELARAHLMTEHRPSRYAFHDLLRTYATELAQSHDSDAERAAATRRVHDHYLHTAHAAALLQEPDREPITLAPAQPGVAAETLTDAGQALAWFTVEHPVLLAVIQETSQARYDTHSWQLAWSLKSYLQWQGHWHDWVATQQAALAATRRLGDSAGQAIAHRLLGGAHGRLGHDADAHLHLRKALDLYAQLGDRDGEARTSLSLALTLETRGRYHEALEHAQHALDLHRATGHLSGQARALNAIGWLHALLGDYEEALTSCQQAVPLFSGSGDHIGAAAAWDSLGYTHCHLGHDRQALACYQQALELLEEVGDRYLTAMTLTNLGDARRAAGDIDAAAAAWQHALDIFAELDHPDAESLRARLRLQDGGACSSNETAAVPHGGMSNSVLTARGDGAEPQDRDAGIAHGGNHAQP